MSTIISPPSSTAIAIAIEAMIRPIRLSTPIDGNRQQSTPAEVGFRRQSSRLPQGLPQILVLDVGNKNPQMLAHLGISD
jgi:hypothetical protein